MVLNAIFEFLKSPNLSPFQIPFLGIVGIPRADSEAIIPRKRRVAHTTLPAETSGIGVFLVPGSITLLSARLALSGYLPSFSAWSGQVPNPNSLDEFGWSKFTRRVSGCQVSLGDASLRSSV